MAQHLHAFLAKRVPEIGLLSNLCLKICTKTLFNPMEGVMGHMALFQLKMTDPFVQNCDQITTKVAFQIYSNAIDFFIASISEYYNIMTSKL